ncbi:MAG: hypothetical protein ACUVRP_02765 [Chlorobiales bacterium]
MNKLAVITSILLLLGINASSTPLAFIEGDVIEIQHQSCSDATQTQNSSSTEIEDCEEEPAILTQLKPLSPENFSRCFPNHADKILIGAPPGLVIPPNI